MKRSKAMKQIEDVGKRRIRKLRRLCEDIDDLIEEFHEAQSESTRAVGCVPEMERAALTESNEIAKYQAARTAADEAMQAAAENMTAQMELQQCIENTGVGSEDPPLEDPPTNDPADPAAEIEP